MNKKIYLVLLKYIPHSIAVLYAIYTLFQFMSIDLFILGRLIHVSAFSWIFMILNSLVFKYCYIHRLPLYYILANDLLTDLDYYVSIPISDINLLLIHLLLIGITVLGYSLYYDKNYKKFTETND